MKGLSLEPLTLQGIEILGHLYSILPSLEAAHLTEEKNELLEFIYKFQNSLETYIRDAAANPPQVGATGLINWGLATAHEFADAAK